MDQGRLGSSDPRPPPAEIQDEDKKNVASQDMAMLAVLRPGEPAHHLARERPAFAMDRPLAAQSSMAVHGGGGGGTTMSLPPIHQAFPEILLDAQRHDRPGDNRAGPPRKSPLVSPARPLAGTTGSTFTLPFEMSKRRRLSSEMPTTSSGSSSTSSATRPDLAMPPCRDSRHGSLHGGEPVRAEAPTDPWLRRPLDPFAAHASRTSSPGQSDVPSAAARSDWRPRLPSLPSLPLGPESLPSMQMAASYHDHPPHGGPLAERRTPPYRDSFLDMSDSPPQSSMAYARPDAMGAQYGPVYPRSNPFVPDRSHHMPSTYPYSMEYQGMGGDARGRKKRGNLPKETTDQLRAWFMAHLQHPYPTEDEKQELMARTGLQMNQISNWFINARRRHLPALTRDARSDTDVPSKQSTSTGMGGAMPPSRTSPGASDARSLGSPVEDDPRARVDWDKSSRASS